MDSTADLDSMPLGVHLDHWAPALGHARAVDYPATTSDGLNSRAEDQVRWNRTQSSPRRLTRRLHPNSL